MHDPFLMIRETIFSTPRYSHDQATRVFGNMN